MKKKEVKRDRKIRPDDPKCLCDTAATRGYSRYYDYPDGCDVPTKVMVATRYGLLTGLIMSTYDVLMYSHAVGLAPIMSRYMFHTLPLAGMGASFAAVANGAQHFRERDDPWNYFIGGAACSPLLTYYLGSKHALVLGALALGTIGFIKKTAIDEGWLFFPPITPHMNTINGWRHDYTLARDPKDDIVEDKKCFIDSVIV